MFENIMRFFKRANKKEALNASSKETAKERLHLVLMQDRANVSADFLDLMRQEIIEVIKKYIDIDESAMDVSLTNQSNEDGTQGPPALYANIPIINIKYKAKNKPIENEEKNSKEPDKKEEKSVQDKQIKEKQNQNSNEIKEKQDQSSNETKSKANKLKENDVNKNDKKVNSSHNPNNIKINKEKPKKKVEQNNSTFKENNTKKVRENE